MIIKVLSESTEKYDRGRTFAHYRTLQSLQEYLLVAQDRVSIERYARQEPAGDAWTLTSVDDPEGVVPLASIQATVPVAVIYRGVEFPAAPEK